MNHNTEEESQSILCDFKDNVLSPNLLDIGGMVVNFQQTNWKEPPTPYESEGEYLLHKYLFYYNKCLTSV